MNKRLPIVDVKGQMGKYELILRGV